MNNGIRLSVLVAGIMLSGQIQAEPTRIKPPDGVKVYLISPGNGETVSSPVLVRFGLKGMGVAPAGEENAKTGHHHLLIDQDAQALNLNAPYPFNEQTRHFGAGQTEVALELKPGVHTLQLLFGDAKHTSFDPPLMSEKISITVK